MTARRRLLILLGLGFVLLLALLRLGLFFSAGLLARSLRTFFERDVTVGAVQVRWFPLRAEVAGLRVAGKEPKDPPFLEIARVVAVPSLAQVWERTLALRELRLESPRVRINAYKTGGDDLPPFGRREGGGGDIRLERLVVQGGEVFLDHERVPVEADLPDFQGRLDVRRDRALSGRLTFGPGQLRFGPGRPWSSRARSPSSWPAAASSSSRAASTPRTSTWRRRERSASGRPCGARSPSRGRWTCASSTSTSCAPASASRAPPASKAPCAWRGPRSRSPVVPWERRGPSTGWRFPATRGTSPGTGTASASPASRRGARRDRGARRRGALGHHGPARRASRDAWRAPTSRGSSPWSSTGGPREWVRAPRARWRCAGPGAGRARSRAAWRWTWRRSHRRPSPPLGSIPLVGGSGRAGGRAGRSAHRRAGGAPGRPGPPRRPRRPASRRRGQRPGRRPTSCCAACGRPWATPRPRRWAWAAPACSVAGGRAPSRSPCSRGASRAATSCGGACTGGTRPPRARSPGTAVEARSLLLRREASTLFVDGRFGTGSYGLEDGMEGRARLTDWPAADLVRAFEWDLPVEGPLTGDAVLRGRRSAPAGEATLEAGRGELLGGRLPIGPGPACSGATGSHAGAGGAGQRRRAARRPSRGA